eukprot:CAMPEP_0176385718 /NCGR_PEP_ID=MMETSP0126-20121128/35372_1 /TAXON_ID=141414 ORGANISM="Strombidinopsis acuminatum, Strain SPMC142" /NCGR_SAMPLE_ID=MMETSP0126 /ASSEMBLY_ACC=CAM_ASM_000229 /LENGTH=159 /DNA_ID=CAMNT_0017752243 /DNA_START=295 /DNA_END=774 /DNA_ORIENTATION=-
MILLDGRWEFDHALDETLGPIQWYWLDKVLGREHEKEPDLTLIAHGTNFIPVYRLGFMESFGNRGKERLFELINKHQKSNVVLMSGDIHFSQFFATQCSSLTGYQIIELTTSGMTHNDPPIIHPVIYFWTPTFFTLSDMYAKFNYGTIALYKEPLTEKI